MSDRSQDVNRRQFLKTGLGAAAGAAWAAKLASPARAAEQPTMPATDEIFGWVEDLWRLGKADRYGYRMPGTKSDRQAADYVLNKFEHFGLSDTRIEPVPAAAAFPDAWKLTVSAGEKTEEIPCYFLRYAKFTNQAGVTAPLVYVGEGTEANYARADVSGKIVVADLVSDGLRPPITNTFKPGTAFFTYDPDGTLAGDKGCENWPPQNFAAAYEGAVKRGAAGFIGILKLMAGDVNQYLHVYLRYELPAVTVGDKSGARLREMLRSGSAQGRIVLTGFRGQAETYNVYGFVPGKTDSEVIVMMSHHDGWATNEASGAAVVLGLAKYFGQLPPKAMNRTLMFFLVGSHFGMEADWGGRGLEYLGRGLSPAQTTERFGLNSGWDRYKALAWELLPKTVCANNVEMIARQYKRKGDDFVLTGRISPRMWGVTGPSEDAGNPALVSFVREAIETHKLERSMVSHFFIGEANRYAQLGIPTVHLISHNPWQFTDKDTPETVMKEALGPTVAAYADILRREDAAAAAALKPAATASEVELPK